MKHTSIVFGIALFLCISFSSEAEAADLTNREKAIIVLILENTNEVAIHQMRGETGNNARRDRQ